MAEVGKYRAIGFQAQHGEELESILAAGGLNPKSLTDLGDGEYVPALVGAILTVFGNPNLKERVGQFTAAIWDHPLQAEIDEAEDNDSTQEAFALIRKKRNIYKRLPGNPRNEILRSMFDQEDFKEGFLASYLSLLPEELAKQVREEIGSVLADMREQLTPSKEDTDTKKAKSAASQSKGSSATKS